VTEKKNKLNVVSLFAGAGGLDIAACSTGAVGRLFSTDSNPVFLQTIIDNMPGHFPDVLHSHIVADAKELDGEQIRQQLASDKIDLVIGGPPCDDYTRFGKKRGADGPKGLLIFEFARLVRELSPRAFIFENVPNLAAQFHAVFNQLLNRFRESNYHVIWNVLSASDFGSPTQRKRIFVVGIPMSLFREIYKFPLPTHSNASEQLSLHGVNQSLRSYVTVANVLNDLPDVTELRAKEFQNHTGRKHRPRTIEHLKSVPQGVAINKSYRYRAPLDGLCRSLTAGTDDATKSYIHPIFHREMSVREYARIHGFPDSWGFNGNHHNGIKQVANAVPVPLGRAMLNTVTCAVARLYP
jgi:DNA (cytosine-5)-methyltransferase 1